MTYTLSKLIAGAALITSLSACSLGVSEAPPIDSQKQAALSMMEPWMTDSAPGVAIAISHNDEVVFADAGGLANLEHEIALTPESVFQVASVSKQFTAFAVLMLVAEGQVDLDADIRDYIPEFQATPTPITVAHLLDHMSGLRETSTLAAMAGWQDDDIRTHAQSIGLTMRQRGVNFNAGAEVEYSNTGYALLAEIAARVSGQSFQEFTRSRIFEPLGMTQTRFIGSRGTLIHGRAASYYPSEDGFMNIVAASETYGSTGLYTTALDLLKWAENFDTQQVGNDLVFSLMAQRAQAENGTDATFAKGQERRMYNGLETWSHGGRDAGYRSFLMRVPREDFTVSIISNRTDFDTAKIAFGLVDVYLKDAVDYVPEVPPAWEPASAEDLAAYCGDYEMYPGVILSVRADEDGLKFGQMGSPLNDTEQIGPRRFALNVDASLSVIFDPVQNGQSPGFGYTLGLHGTIRAERAELSPFDPASVQLAEYAGIYDSAELRTAYELVYENEGLTAKHARRDDFPLTPYQEDHFIGQGPLQELAFERDQTGQITGLKASTSLAEGVAFTRRSLRK